MHIPDGFLDTKTWVTAAAASAATISYTVKKVSKEFDEKDPPLMGVLAAFIFAAQMLNFPVAGGTSGHFVGAALAAILLGPWKSMLVMLSVVGVQALLFGDGGITSLGANVLNMAIIAPFIAYWIYEILKRFNIYVGTFAAGLISTVVAATACSIELASSGTIPFVISAPLMTGWHLLIGIGEGLITAATVSYLVKVRPDLVRGQASLDWRSLLVFGGVSVFFALFLSPLASTFPDGLERVAHDLGFIKKETNLFKALIPDYAMPGLRSEGLATGLAGFIGVLVTILIGYGIATIAKRRSSGRIN
ncbi:MAG: energy-coupling factor ABC transporter permease [Actinomycetota bacterium]|nr:energy-coupling factor ABC transporter permease [Actinomycetota bacterium]